MTNRQMMMLKLIQLSDEEFAEFMSDEIMEDMDWKSCDSCINKHDGACPMKNGEQGNCIFEMVEWLRKKAS